MKLNVIVILMAILAGCTNGKKYPTVGTIQQLSPSLDSILIKENKPEIIADGFDWSEGPLWLEDKKMLLFSDIPPNTIYSWTEEKGKQVYLTPSGYTDTIKRGGEVGSNGLTLDEKGRLVLCQHGDRQLAVMDATLDQPAAKFISLAKTYSGKKFNSPNDVVVNTAGEAFFTDPPYGLEKNMEDPAKEIPYQGVYKLKKNGEVILLVDSISRPNGIAFFPGEKRILISSSDPGKPNWYVYDVEGDSLKNGKIFYSAAGYDKNLKGLPDGLKIDKEGNVFATGPGGVWIFNNKGELAGKILVPEATSNCAFTKDEKTLFITNDMNILRIKLRN